ncbi:MAG: hypothetical protein IJH37_09125 [Clostridia bacterium]|nr:hypothetical protein [Clostridia bacterium]
MDIYKTIAVIAAAFTLTTGAVRAADAVTFNYNSKTARVDDETVETQGAPFLYANNIYVPVDDILKLTGFSLGWNGEKGAVTAYKNGTLSYIAVNSSVLEHGDAQKTFDVPTRIYKGVYYMPLVMFAEMSDASIYFEGTPERYRDLLTDTFVTDQYRLSGSANTYKGITIIGNCGMELLGITDSTAASYAAMVNSVANAMPPEVNVFNAAVPTACEFYAPKSLYTNQVGGIKKIYAALGERVVPINTVRPLMDHAAEKIFFNTDHHWTQRGAYYVYREFAGVQGFSVPALESFEKKDSWSHVGSFAGFTRGTYGESIMRSNPELLERFLPKYECQGAAYSDMYMKNKYASLQAVNTANNTYSCFMGGDCPVARFVTSNKNGRKLCIIKESYGIAFASWAINNYEEIYIIDPREFNGFNGHNQPFKLKTFYDLTGFNDLVIINYPGAMSGSGYRGSVLKML